MNILLENYQVFCYFFIAGPKFYLTHRLVSSFRLLMLFFPTSSWNSLISVIITWSSLVCLMVLIFKHKPLQCFYLFTNRGHIDATTVSGANLDCIPVWETPLFSWPQVWESAQGHWRWLCSWRNMARHQYIIGWSFLVTVEFVCLSWMHVPMRPMPCSYCLQPRSLAVTSRMIICIYYHFEVSVFSFYGMQYTCIPMCYSGQCLLLPWMSVLQNICNVYGI